jgi:DNA replication initiation complex subunit (GINS family)
MSEAHYSFYAALSKIHWKQTIPGSQPYELPNTFYEDARIYLETLNQRKSNDPKILREYDRASDLVKDIVNRRVTWICSCALKGMNATALLPKLTEEESELLEALSKTINEWKHVNIGAAEVV